MREVSLIKISVFISTLIKYYKNLTIGRLFVEYLHSNHLQYNMINWASQ